ncbi:uncharacterized protein LOC121754559 [Salvia splendens]|uniref:uncharacterized protein LOC121754559 n=1 Tax=Salvia splendens TaxID=180675 RepID=UPI001C2744AE|nr:uncharacterized protein LOC121754559 [Salvia splendens]
MLEEGVTLHLDRQRRLDPALRKEELIVGQKDLLFQCQLKLIPRRRNSKWADPRTIMSGDSDEEAEGGAQPAAAPAEKAESVPPPHAEGTSAQNAPSPPSDGSSTSPLQGPSQPIEVVTIDNNSTEDLQPPPSDILLQPREADWVFHQAVENEPDEKEKQPLRRRTRQRNMARIIEEVEARVADKPGREEEPEQRLRIMRRLMDEPEEANQGTGEAAEEREVGKAGEEREGVEDSHDREERERKRKGKSVLPPPKRMRPATWGIVITNATQHAPPREGDEGKDTKK